MATESRRDYQKLDDVRRELVLLGGLVIESLPRSTEALLAGDLVAADEVISDDDVVDVRTLAVEDRCCQLLALQQPMAGDLRQVVTALRLSSEIERSADLVVNISKAARRLYDHDLSPRLRGLISRMSEQAQDLFRHAIDAYADGDAALGAAIDDMDDLLDRTQAEFIQAIFESHTNDHLDLQAAVQLAVIGRFFERIGDHAVNIGQRVQYMVKGLMPEHAAAARLAAAAQQAAEAGGAAPASDASGAGPREAGVDGDGPVPDATAPTAG